MQEFNFIKFFNYLITFYNLILIIFFYKKITYLLNLI